MNDRFRVLQRQPRRISITLSYFVHESLLSRSEEEGRSVSNLCAFLLEDALRDHQRDGQREGQQPLPVMTHSHGPMGNGRIKTHSF
jgi:macrodomain Ter protein organizer (MatP/YcbG family)